MINPGTIRRSAQIFFLFLFITLIWSTTFPLKAILPPDIFFTTNPLIMGITCISERVILPGLILAGIMLILTLVLGRFYCGWICPLGTLIDLAGVFALNKGRKVSPAEQKMARSKYLVLFLIFIVALAGIQIAWIFDPMGTVARFVSMNLIPAVTLFLENTFRFLVRDLGFTGPVYDLYRMMKMNILGVKVHFYMSSIPIFIFFAAIVLLSILSSRFWCRFICPLGAIYAGVSKRSLLRRKVEGCIDCGSCAKRCPTGAIPQGPDYDPAECVLCLECLSGCPARDVQFCFSALRFDDKTLQDRNPLSRKEFLFLILASLTNVGFIGRKKTSGASLSRDSTIRPPGALAEKDMVDRCVRCGNCMKVCPTNALHPSFLECGASGIWTPRLVPEIGYCEYNCALCGSVCPTGAIEHLTVPEKKRIRIGTADVKKERCLAWAKGLECMVCEEHCPVPEKAIKASEKVTADGRTIKRPVVDTGLCIGCGICQNKCPVRPQRAIKVDPSSAKRHRPS